MKNHILRMLLFSAISSGSAVAVFAQQPATLPANYIRVSAPNAQKLALATIAKHPEITKIGIHATPVGAGANAIIAADAPAKIGKKSSDKDLAKLTAGQPTSEPIDKEHIYDLFLPMKDAKGRNIGDGFIVMEVPYTKAHSADEALKMGTVIRNEVQKQIPSEAFLYQ